MDKLIETKIRKLIKSEIKNIMSEDVKKMVVSPKETQYRLNDTFLTVKTSEMKKTPQFQLGTEAEHINFTEQDIRDIITICNEVLSDMDSFGK